MENLKVFREYKGEYEEIGSLALNNSNNSGTASQALFSYANDYLTRTTSSEISHSLPLSLGAEPLNTPFFDGLLPEEAMRKAFEAAARTQEGSASSLLERLNNESVGALVFGTSVEDLTAHRGYKPVSPTLFTEFAQQPQKIALQTGMASRLSLAGAQAKMGLRYWDGEWYLPIGSAPSTHIIKASSEVFSDLAINEAFCLEVARQLDFDVAHVNLLVNDDGSTLLATERFDRTQEECPKRLHQEDFLQAWGSPTWGSPTFNVPKYEPTDGNYAINTQALISQASTNPFADRFTFFKRLVFDALIGNTDNHLKNHSFLWSADWQLREVSPLYDITCCTIYPFLDREMGIGLCESRRIDDVSLQTILKTAERSNIPSALAQNAVQEVLDGFEPAAKRASEQLLKTYGNTLAAPKIQTTINTIMSDCRTRLEHLS